MISRSSVKKPYTVVVAVVLILILGVVSFGKMNTDLLPSMNLPYAIVMTTYSGASPETVEAVVTKPIEQSMATVTDIENVSSQSRENVSMVVLEFAESANMDSASIEIREKLDQISGYWDDSVGKPMVMKLNPDMMPIMVAAVEMDGMEASDVTDYVKNHIQAEVESVAGVASVSTTGTITESVEVLLNEEKIKAVNKKVKKALDSQFEDKEQELKEAQEELDEGREKLEDGREELKDSQKKLEQGKEQAASGLSQGAQQMEAAGEKIASGQAEINQKLAELEEKQKELDDGFRKIKEGREQAEQGLKQLNAAQTGIEQLTAAIASLDEKKAELDSQLAAAGEAAAAIDQQLGALDADPSVPGYEEARNQLVQQKAQLEESSIPLLQQGLTEIENNRATLQAQLDQAVSALGKANAQEALDYIAEQNTTIWNTLEELASGEEQLNAGQAQLNAGKEQLNQAKKQIEDGKTQISNGKAQMNTKQFLASIDMSTAQAKLDAGLSKIEENQAEMDNAQSQLDSGRKQLEDAKEKAGEQADLETLITPELVKGILAGENFSMPAGYLKEGREDYLVRVGDKLSDKEGLEELVLLDLGIDGLEPIRLKDVADVAEQDDSDRVYARLNGNPGVMLTIEKQTGYSTGDVTDRILERLDEIEAEQEKVHFSVLMNQGIYIDLVVDSVLQNMLSGAVLAVLILLLFLKDIRSTIIIACSIPISVVAAFVLMYFTGITLNVISLSGLALGIGMLVDNSIVVIENIDRLRQKGVPVRRAAVEGASQVSGAIAASTLTTVCVFAPIVFTEGITRQLFVDMGLTIAYSLISSLLVALTLVPMMSAGLMKHIKPKKHRLLDKIKELYGRLLGWTLKFKLPVLVLSVALLVGSAVLAVRRGTAFMPPMESTQATMTVTTEKGTPFEKTVQCADEVIRAVEDIEDIESIGAMAGGSTVSGMMGGSGEADSVSIYLLLKEDKKLSGEELEKEITKRTKDIACEVSISTQSMDMSALGGTGIQLWVKGKDLDQLAQLAGRAAEAVEKTAGTKNVSDGMEESDKEYRISVNKEKAMEYKLTVAQVFTEIQKRLAEAQAATTLSTTEKDYSVYVRDSRDEEMTRKDLENLNISYTDADGAAKEVKLSKIADFSEALGPQTIQRDSQTRYMVVSAEIAEGYNIGLVSREVEKNLKELTLPRGYTVEMKGEDETINEAMGQLTLMLVLALVFMYLIMVAQFQSLLSPFIIMFTIPLAFTGGFMGLVAAQKEVSVIAMIGFIMLSGIIVNNGIVLVDYTNQLRAEGMEKREALVQAGKDRLRPIIMTALTTILGLSTMAAGMGMGGGMVQPMAIVTIGGLIYGTLLTLFVVPCIYDLMNRKKYKRIEIEEEEEKADEKADEQKV